MADWQPIETAPRREDCIRNRVEMFLLVKFFQYRDEDGEPAGEVECAWSAVVYLTHSGWMIPTNCIANTHGYGSFLARDDATHWMPLPAPPEPQP